MKRDGKDLRLSASDLANHLGCRHLTTLNVDVALGKRKRPEYFDPVLKTLQERGLAHESAYLAHLESKGLNVVRLRVLEDPSNSHRETVDAMRSGADVIAQATLLGGRWLGYADILRKVPKPSALGAYSYEAEDTKLSRETKAGAVLQLALYSDLLEELQGVRPEFMTVVAPGAPFQFDQLRFEDYRAYYRWVRRRLESVTAKPETPRDEATTPEPVPKCDTCNWVRHCEGQLREKDHLSFVAGITRSQRRELVERNVHTLEALAQVKVPLEWRPERGSVESLVKVREQARLQLEGRQRNKLRHELLEPAPDRGLALLPEPSVGDLFFDFEGDPFVDGGGLEYLFGYAFWDEATKKPAYRSLWALNRAEEKRAFETFVDDLMARWTRHPDLHVYHFAPYEPAAMRRLMGRHGTREVEVDQMLRGGLFVDLFAVVRQGLRASVESYSIKKLEPFFAFERDVPLPEVGSSKRALEAALELAPPGTQPELDAEWKHVVEAYNRDDCLSAMKLREWLETLRQEWANSGRPLPRPAPQEAAPSEEVSEADARSRALCERLLANVPEDVTARTEDHRARVLLAALVDFHRREDKVSFWEYYRLRELPENELEHEARGLTGLKFVSAKPLKGRQRVPVHVYSFPPQELEVKVGDEVFEAEATGKKKKFATVEAVDRERRTIELKKTGATANVHPQAVFFHKHVPSDELRDSMHRICDWVATHGSDAEGLYRCGRDLLLARPPRLNAQSRGLRPLPGESSTEHATRVVMDLNHGVLPIQGPPGAGKTYTGARMIAALVAAGKRVGVTAVSHKVILNLLNEVVKLAKEQGTTIRCGHKHDEDDRSGDILTFAENADALDELQNGRLQVLGGTSWLWANEAAANSVDVLFIDEAGQLSLANALAVSAAAPSLVLLGDPRQLEQPQKGSHPDGAEVSALEHLLGDHLTVPEDRGLFLRETWRMHPAITAFTSESFYEGRLQSRPGLTHRHIPSTAIPNPGLYLHTVTHQNRSNTCPEEVDAIASLMKELLQSGDLPPEEILILAPYNAQVDALTSRLPNMRVGTVDKFQGQEAAVVLISMTSSSIDDAPRGMEFLFSPNRLNVATSRAKCACVVVASPLLFEVDCRTPRQIALANTLARYRDLAEPASPTIANS